MQLSTFHVYNYVLITCHKVSIHAVLVDASVCAPFDFGQWRIMQIKLFMNSLLLWNVYIFVETK